MKVDWDSMDEMQRVNSVLATAMVNRCESMVAAERDAWKSTSQAAKQLNQLLDAKTKKAD